MENRVYGYARVSSREQNEDRQVEALIRFGVPESGPMSIKWTEKS